MAPCITSRTQWLSDTFSCSLLHVPLTISNWSLEASWPMKTLRSGAKCMVGLSKYIFTPNLGPSFSKGQPLLVWNTELWTGEATSKQARWVGCQAHTQIRAHKRLPLLWIASCSEKLQCPLGWKFHLAKVEMEGIQHLPWSHQAKERMGYAGQLSTDTSSVGMEQTESIQV